MQTVNRERRRNQRVPKELQMDLGTVSGTTRNISVSGFFFETDTPFAVGCEVQFVVDLDTPEGRQALRCRGEVLRIRPHAGRMGIAVRILDSTIADR